MRSAAKHVADGGDIVYSTCTVTRAENLDVAKRFLESEEGAAFSLGKIGGKNNQLAQQQVDEVVEELNKMGL